MQLVISVSELLLQCRHLLVDELKLPSGRCQLDRVCCVVVRELLVQIRPQPEHYRDPRDEETRCCRSDPEQHLFVDDDSKDSKLQCSSCAV